MVGALVSGAVLLPAAPALADVTAQPGALTLKPGEEKTINITVSDLGPGQSPQANISVTGLGNDVTLRGPGGCTANGGGLRCNQNAFDKDGDKFELDISVSHKAQTSVEQGKSKDGSITIDAGGGNGDDSVNITLQGPAQAASVPEVSGKVTNQATGDGIPGAQVTLKDSAGKSHDATANSQGNYSIKPSNNELIAPGQVTVTVTKEGFSDATATGNAQAGKALTVPVRMKPTAASAEPSAPVASDPGPTTDPSGAATDVATPQNTSGEDEGPSMLSWILIGMGILLVLLGIGAIVLLVMRRKDDTEGDDPDGYGVDPRMAPAGAYGGDRTMVGGRSNANEQTAIVDPQQLDEFPDPYAAPPPAPTRAGGAYSGGYDDPRTTNVAPGYGGGEYVNGGGYRDERGYGAQQGGYGEEPRGYGGAAGGGGGYADQPTGLYQGNGANGAEYGASGSGYAGGGANGYAGGSGAAGGSANGYGGGYGQANGVNGGGANGYGANGYDPGADGGYEGDYGRRGGGDYEGDYGRRGGGDYQR